MKIGEFAQAAGLPISVLRHYDQKGLLIPDYIDSFTGYRYYSAGQLERVHKITLLKQAGLSLKEIRDILSKPYDRQFILRILNDRRTKYQSMLTAIEEAENNMLNKNEGTQIPFPSSSQGGGQNCQIIIERENDEHRQMGSYQGICHGGESYWIYGWTRCYVLGYRNHTACASEIVSAQKDIVPASDSTEARNHENVEYLIMEWKSGDYIRGGADTDYYVFVREK